MKTPNEGVLKARAAHHAALAAMLPPGSKLTGLSVWRKLRRIEREANSIGLDMCNTGISEAEKERRDAAVESKIKAIFGKLPKGFFINHDPRGYALKLEEGSGPAGLHRDWGNYQILACEIDV